MKVSMAKNNSALPRDKTIAVFRAIFGLMSVMVSMLITRADTFNLSKRLEAIETSIKELEVQ